MPMDFPTTGVQFDLPIPSPVLSDTMPIISDSGKIRRLQKNSSSQRQELAVLTAKIRNTNMKAWFDFIQVNFGKEVGWSLSGVQLFTRAATDIQVLIVGYTDPSIPEDDPLHWQHQITLKYISTN